MAATFGKRTSIGEVAAKRINRPVSAGAVPFRAPSHNLALRALQQRRGPFHAPLPGARSPFGWPLRPMSASHPAQKPDEASRVARGTPHDMPASTTSVMWKCTIRSTSPLLGDSGARLSIAVIDNDSEVRSESFSVDSWKPPKEVLSAGAMLGWEREGTVLLPVDIRSPGAVLLRKLPSVKDKAPAQDYISSIQLVSFESVFTIPADSWVSSDHGWRFFGEGAYLPKDTPAPLVDERRRELEALQGTPESRLDKRMNTDRIYWYQVYNDLSSGKTDNLVRPNLGNSKELPYPRRLATNRGNEPDGREKPPAKGEEFWVQMDERFSFHKNVDFNGGTLQGGLNTALALIAEAAGRPSRGPISLINNVAVGAIRELVGRLPGVEGPLENFEDFNDVIALYKKAAGPDYANLLPTSLYPASHTSASSGSSGSGTSLKEKVVRAVSPLKTADGAWDFTLPEDSAAKIDDFIADQRVGPMYDAATGKLATTSRSIFAFDSKPGATATKDRLGSRLWNTVRATTQDVNSLLNFTPPRVLEGRPDAWHSDEEYGRQLLAGFNPSVITALRKLPEEFGSAIRGRHVNADLQGSTLEQLVAEAAKGAKPRLYMVDYWDLSAFWESAANAGGGDQKKFFWEKAAKESSTGLVQHAGRAVFYLRKDSSGQDAGLIPVAIELAHPATHKDHPELSRTAGLVYSRSELAADAASLPVWRLAKMVFKSLDSSFHQLISHWNRTHAVLEPFFIAMRRNVSAMHPVYKLMAPHFRYTLTINRNARSSLINAGGIIEKSFSAGAYAMRLASVVYGKYWNFATEALPEDLRARGMVDPSNGQPWLDYPYATDGLDMWRELSAYFNKYLRLYYKSDQEVLEDPELQAWWQEVKSEGHPDLLMFGLRSSEEQLWGFAGPIPSVDRLVTVLATIGWLASGHHAAVNFGQYDFTSFILNASSMIRKPMPAPGDKAYQALISARSREKQEGLIMEYLSDPLTACTVAATVKLLSTHARDEHTLDEANELLTDPAARALNAEFIAAMKRLEAAIETRNANPANWARFSLAEKDKAGPLPYTLLSPSSRAGITMRGVPYSVSI